MATVGALIGWSTNLIAIKLLFRPLHAYKIPLVGLEVQGLIPKRRRDIARSVANTIENELLSLETIFDRIIEGIDKKQVLAMLEDRLVKVIKDNLPSLLAPFSGAIARQVHEIIERDGDQLLTEVTEALIHKAVGEVKIADMIEGRILEMDLMALESMIIDLAKKELKQIEVLGGILGLLVGLVQGAITLIFFV